MQFPSSHDQAQKKVKQVSLFNRKAKSILKAKSIVANLLQPFP